jgi:hypothetical protein
MVRYSADQASCGLESGLQRSSMASTIGLARDGDWCPRVREDNSPTKASRPPLFSSAGVLVNLVAVSFDKFRLSICQEKAINEDPEEKCDSPTGASNAPLISSANGLVTMTLTATLTASQRRVNTLLRTAKEARTAGTV